MCRDKRSYLQFKCCGTFISEDQRTWLQGHIDLTNFCRYLIIAQINCTFLLELLKGLKTEQIEDAPKRIFYFKADLPEFEDFVE